MSEVIDRVKTDMACHNLFLFDQSKENDYEVHYFLWNDPKQGISMMFRYEMVKRPSFEDSTAAVWGTFWDNNISDNNVGLIQYAPVDQLYIAEDKKQIDIGESGMNKQKAWGKISNDQASFEWSFDIDATNAIPVNRIENLGKTTFLPNFSSDYCRSKLNGWVNVNGHRYEINDLKASDGHYSNIQNLFSWTWGNCVNFKDDPDFVFEGISIKYNNWMSPSLCLFFFWEGKRYETSLVDSMFIHKETGSELDSWSFIAEKDDVRFDCEISANPEDMILLIHPLPDGNAFYTHITLSANMQINISKKTNQEWQNVKSIRAERTATFEVTKPVKHSLVNREFLKVIKK